VGDKKDLKSGETVPLIEAVELGVFKIKPLVPKNSSTLEFPFPKIVHLSLVFLRCAWKRILYENVLQI
jgi:hypothetical protein